METIGAYLIWMIITSVWSYKKDDSKEAAIFRYCFTFALFSIGVYFTSGG